MPTTSSAEIPNTTTPESAARATARSTGTNPRDDRPGGRRAAVVYNPIKVDVEVLRAAVAAAEHQAGFEPSLWLETEEDDPGSSMAREAAHQGVDVVLAAGGDGTVRAVAEGLRGSSVPLALLPSGTGNLLARNLKLTLDNLEVSVAAAFAGGVRDIDLGIVELRRSDGSTDELCFVVMAGMGLDAQMLANTDDDLKKKAGWLAYGHALVTSMKGGRRIRLRYVLDDNQQHNARVHTLLIGNCGSLPGNILLLPEAALDDGLLDIVALRPEGLLGWLQIWSKIIVENGLLRRTEVGHRLTGATASVRALRYLRGAKLQVQLRKGGPEEFQLDGDPVGQVVSFTVRVEPMALRVRVPQ